MLNLKMMNVEFKAQGNKPFPEIKGRNREKETRKIS